jgi:hypothetical protein
VIESDPKEKFQTKLTGAANPKPEAHPTQRTEKEKVKVKEKEKKHRAAPGPQEVRTPKGGDSAGRKLKCPQGRKSRTQKRVCSTSNPPY